ncbi:hypothetical protein Clacol_004921 [Clathrus columnatus]|uniref:Uncharacterized protein n=1 Tax=Clathrus columnatus TaxID=1419009 RepID=A0AAV5A7U7_9AGAM|nr:hypothetical protein Clacol_004921 [Clathrus columnatus]
MFCFMKNMRCANLFILTLPGETYYAAYKEFANSGLVAGGEWDIQRDKPIHWEPKPEDREVYVDFMQGFVQDHPLTSPINAVTVLFASNGGAMCILRFIVGDRPRKIRKMFWAQVHKLNNKDLVDTKDVRYGRKPFSTLTDVGDIARGSDEGPSHTHLSPDPNAFCISNNVDYDNEDYEDNKLFIRSKNQPTVKIPPGEWKEFESVGETYFSEDIEDETGYIAFELTVIDKTTTSQNGWKYRESYFEVREAKGSRCSLALAILAYILRLNEPHLLRVDVPS